MDIRKLQRAIVDGLEDVKGQNIVVFNTEHLSALFERVVIASGTSNRQTKALAASVRDAVRAKGFGPMRTEGEENGEWIIVDCGAAVVHLMQPSIREYYHLEEIWGDKPVRLKLDSAAPRLVKASEPEPVVKQSTAAKKAPARKTSATKSAARKRAAPASRKPAATAAPAKKAAMKKAPARKAAPVRKAVTRSVGVKSSGASAARSKPAAARRAPAAKAATRATKTARRKT
jgi:ribosome-associated protein